MRLLKDNRPSRASFLAGRARFRYYSTQGGLYDQAEKARSEKKQARPEPAKIIAKAEELAPVNYVPPCRRRRGSRARAYARRAKGGTCNDGAPPPMTLKKKLPLKRSLVISEQDLQALAEKILAELDIDPGEVTEKKIEATAKVIGADIFSKIFHDNPAILEQHVLNAPKYIERYEEVRTYKSNWERLLKALHDKKPSYINHSKDWDRISRILRRCYRPEAVKKKAQEIDVKKAEALEWDVLTELQRARFPYGGGGTEPQGSPSARSQRQTNQSPGDQRMGTGEAGKTL